MTRPNPGRAQPAAAITQAPGGPVDQAVLTELYNAMPTTGRRGPVRYFGAWAESVFSQKAAADVMQLISKSLPPLLTALIVPAIAGSALFFRGAIVQLYSSSPTFVLLTACCLVTLLAAALLSALFSWKLHRRLIGYDPHADFKILQYVVSARIFTETHSLYAFRYLVKPRREGLKHFPVLFNWSGQGPASVLPRNRRYTASAARKIPGNFSESVITFDRELEIGLNHIIEYAIITPDSPGMVPSRHVGFNVSSKKYPAFNSHIIVAFDPSNLPISVSRDFYMGGFGLKAIDNQIVTLEEDHRHRWAPRRVFNWSYCISWDFGR